jgi:RNA polymerase sigma-70 factor (ECF subfamily)
MTLDRAFVELRPAMFALAYRITGNRADAEEIVQDAFVRLHDVQPNDPIRSLKSYLATITARLSLNRLRDQRARRETYVGEWLPEPLPTLDEPEVRAEDVSFGLLAVLERLSPSERVVFVLRNAFDFTFEEIGSRRSRCRHLSQNFQPRPRTRCRRATALYCRSRTPSGAPAQLH